MLRTKFQPNIPCGLGEKLILLVFVSPATNRSETYALLFRISIGVNFCRVYAFSSVL